jgi:hypothetical protein
MLREGQWLLRTNLLLLDPHNHVEAADDGATVSVQYLDLAFVVALRMEIESA